MPDLDPAALAAAVRAWQEAAVVAVAPISPIRAALLAYLSAAPDGDRATLVGEREGWRMVAEQRAVEIAALRAQVEQMREALEQAANALDDIAELTWDKRHHDECKRACGEACEWAASARDEARAALSAAPKPGEE